MLCINHLTREYSDEILLCTFITSLKTNLLVLIKFINSKKIKKVKHQS